MKYNAPSEMRKGNIYNIYFVKIGVKKATSNSMIYLL